MKVYKYHYCSLLIMQFNIDLLDNVNLKIMDILSRDSSTPFVEIAKQIGISDATVHLRVRRLIAEGVINKFTISVDNDLLGYDHLAFIGINVEPGFADEAIYELSSLEEVLEVHEMHGTFDLLLKIRAKDLEQMREVVETRYGITTYFRNRINDCFENQKGRANSFFEERYRRLHSLFCHSINQTYSLLRVPYAVKSNLI